MTKTATDGNILTVNDKQDNDKERCDWAHSVTTTDSGVARLEEVPYSRFEAWEAAHPEPQPDEPETPVTDADE